MMKSNNAKEIKAGDWFAIGQLFSEPYCYDDPKSGTPSAENFGLNIGLQSLAALDVASQFVLHGRPFEKTPSPYNASEIVGFLKEVFGLHGKPRVGILLSRSVWQSSAEMLLDDHVGERADCLRKLEIEFGPMNILEKDKVAAWLAKQGIRLEFDENKLQM
jgi:hypothetical protein